MRDSTAFRCRRRRWAFAAAALLVGALSGAPTAAAGWSLRAEPATGGKVPGCSMVSEQQPIPDGYQQTWWENDIIRVFRDKPDTGEIVGERDTPTGRALYIARPIQIKNPACLACHSTPDAAPATMLKLYGTANGFGWKPNEIVGAQIVSVPMAVPVGNARHAFLTFMGSLAAVFALAFVALNVMLTRIIVRPVARMSQAADQISVGNFEVPEFAETGRDEIAQLGRAFNRMRRSLQTAMKMIGA